MKILQISDIHWSKTSSMLDEYKDLRDGMMSYLEAYCDQMKPKFEYIFICGDIAFSGEEEQYGKAYNFIKELCHIIGCSESKVLMVPGNHDKNRNATPILLRNELDKLMGEDAFNSDGVLDDALQTNLDSCKFLFEPFREYDKFASNFGRRETLMAKVFDEVKKLPFDENVDKMYWEEVLPTKLNDCYIHVYGVNTAFTCDANDFDFSDKGHNGHKMFLSKLAYNEPRSKNNSINVLLAHHPVAFLANSEKIKKALDNRYQVQFYGHVHRTDSKVSNNAIHIFSGALQPPSNEAIGEDYKPVFNIVDIDVRNYGDYKNIVVTLDVIAWNGEEFCKDSVRSKTLELKMKSKKIDVDSISKSNVMQVEININDLRLRFFKIPNAEDIINDMKPGSYDSNQVDYTNRLNFWNHVSKNGLWKELLDKMKSYE